MSNREGIKAKTQALERVIQPLREHDEGMLRRKAQQLKQSDGEGWVIGLVVERALWYFYGRDECAKEWRIDESFTPPIEF